MTTDDRVRVTQHEEDMFKTYARSLSLIQLICLIDVAKNELGVRQGTLSPDKRGILKASARERLSNDSLFALDLGEIPKNVDSPVLQSEDSVDEEDPLGMGFS